MSLREELKEKLRIYHDDSATEMLMDGLLKNSKAYLEELTNSTFDYEKENRPKELLLERCRYDYNNSADEFEVNYAKELSRLLLNVALGKVGTLIEEDVSGDV